MRSLALLALIPALAACGGLQRPILIDQDREERPLNDAERERAAQEAIRDVERRIARGDLPKIQFEFDKDEITPESYPTLDLIAKILTNDRHLKCVVLAHTDDVGSRDYNMELSERRAKSVKSYLVKKGVHPPSVRFRGFGFDRPLVSNATDEGRAKNRRVEFRVTNREWEAVY